MSKRLPDRFHIPTEWLAGWAVGRDPAGRAMVWAAPPRAGVQVVVTDAHYLDYVCPRRPRRELVAADRVFRYDCAREPEPEDPEVESLAKTADGRDWVALIPGDAAEAVLRDAFAPRIVALLLDLDAGRRDPELARAELSAALAYLSRSPRRALLAEVTARRGWGWGVFCWDYDRRAGVRGPSGVGAVVGPLGLPRPESFEPLIRADVRAAWQASDAGALALLVAISGTHYLEEPEAVAARPVSLVRLPPDAGGFATGDVVWAGASFGSRDLVVFPLSPRTCLVFSEGGPLAVPEADGEAFCAAVNTAMIAGSHERVVFRPGAPAAEALGAPEGGWHTRNSDQTSEASTDGMFSSQIDTGYGLAL